MKIYIILENYGCDAIKLATTNKKYAETVLKLICSLNVDCTFSINEIEVIE